MTQPNLNKFEFPAINCNPGSAWHDWSKTGAIYASQNAAADLVHGAEMFAIDKLSPGQNKSGPACQAKRKAFIAGANNSHLLREV